VVRLSTMWTVNQLCAARVAAIRSECDAHCAGFGAAWVGKCGFLRGIRGGFDSHTLTLAFDSCCFC
jgi:hypothetical protein